MSYELLFNIKYSKCSTSLDDRRKLRYPSSQHETVCQCVNEDFTHFPGCQLERLDPLMFINIKPATFSTAGDARESEMMIFMKLTSRSHSTELHVIALTHITRLFRLVCFGSYQSDNACHLTPLADSKVTCQSCDFFIFDATKCRFHCPV